MTELYINDMPVDLSEGEEQLAIKYNRKNAGEIDSVFQEFSYTFSIKKSNNNKKVFARYLHPNAEWRFVKPDQSRALKFILTDLRARILVDGNLVMDGYALIQEAKPYNQEVQINIVSAGKTLKSIFGDKTLRDLPFNPTNVFYGLGATSVSPIETHTDLGAFTGHSVNVFQDPNNFNGDPTVLDLMVKLYDYNAPEAILPLHMPRGRYNNILEWLNQYDINTNEAGIYSQASIFPFKTAVAGSFNEQPYFNSDITLLAEDAEFFLHQVGTSNDLELRVTPVGVISISNQGTLADLSDPLLDGKVIRLSGFWNGDYTYKRNTDPIYVTIKDEELVVNGLLERIHPTSVVDFAYHTLSIFKQCWEFAGVTFHLQEQAKDLLRNLFELSTVDNHFVSPHYTRAGWNSGLMQYDISLNREVSPFATELIVNVDSSSLTTNLYANRRLYPFVITNQGVTGVVHTISGNTIKSREDGKNDLAFEAVFPSIDYDKNDGFYDNGANINYKNQNQSIETVIGDGQGSHYVVPFDGYYYVEFYVNFVAIKYQMTAGVNASDYIENSLGMNGAFVYHGSEDIRESLEELIKISVANDNIFSNIDIETNQISYASLYDQCYRYTSPTSLTTCSKSFNNLDKQIGTYELSPTTPVGLQWYSDTTSSYNRKFSKTVKLKKGDIVKLGILHRTNWNDDYSFDYVEFDNFSITNAKIRCTGINEANEAEFLARPSYHNYNNVLPETRIYDYVQGIIENFNLAWNYNPDTNTINFYSNSVLNASVVDLDKIPVQAEDITIKPRETKSTFGVIDQDAKRLYEAGSGGLKDLYQNPSPSVNGSLEWADPNPNGAGFELIKPMCFFVGDPDADYEEKTFISGVDYSYATQFIGNNYLVNANETVGRRSTLSQFGYLKPLIIWERMVQYDGVSFGIGQSIEIVRTGYVASYDKVSAWLTKPTEPVEWSQKERRFVNIQWRQLWSKYAGQPFLNFYNVYYAPDTYAWNWEIIPPLVEMAVHGLIWSGYNPSIVAKMDLLISPHSVITYENIVAQLSNSLKEEYYGEEWEIPVYANASLYNQIRQSGFVKFNNNSFQIIGFDPYRTSKDSVSILKLYRPYYGGQ